MNKGLRISRRARLGCAVMFVFLLASMLGTCAFKLMGSILVFDPDGVVAEASVVNDYAGLERRLSRLPGGTFFGIPDFDGEVRARCHDGQVRQSGYVTRHMHTWIEVTEGCLIREVR